MRSQCPAGRSLPWKAFLGCYAIWNQINYLQQRDPCLCDAGANECKTGAFLLLPAINGSHGKKVVTLQTRCYECEAEIKGWRRRRGSVCSCETESRGVGGGPARGHQGLPATHCSKMQLTSSKQALSSSHPVLPGNPSFKGAAGLGTSEGGRI